MGELVFNEKDRLSLFLQVFQDGDDPPGRVFVKFGGRLVEDQDVVAERQRSRERNPLFLATGQVVGRPGIELGQVGHFHDFGETFFHDRRREPAVLEGREDLLFDGREDHLGFGIIENDADLLGQLGKAGIAGNRLSVKGDGPGFFSAIFMMKDTGSSQAQRGLPGAGRAGDHEALAFR